MISEGATVGLPCKGIYRYVSSFKLLFKPVALLLEDQGSRASCAGYHQRSFMFIAKLDCYIAGEFFPTARALVCYFQVARNLTRWCAHCDCGALWREEPPPS